MFIRIIRDQDGNAALEAVRDHVSRGQRNLRTSMAALTTWLA